MLTRQFLAEVLGDAIQDLQKSAVAAVAHLAQAGVDPTIGGGGDDDGIGELQIRVRPT